jgi:hypothetical protein
MYLRLEPDRFDPDAALQRLFDPFDVPELEPDRSDGGAALCGQGGKHDHCCAHCPRSKHCNNVLTLSTT